LSIWKKKILTRKESCNIIFKSVIVNKCHSKAPECHLTINNMTWRTVCRTFTLPEMNSIFLGGITMKTFMASPATIDRKWYVVDAEGMTLGRLASEVAKVLRGKNKPIFTPHIDTGDYVIVVNAEKVKVTGKKLDQKVYYNHSDYVGGMKETTLKEMMAKHPERVIEHAVKGMLPKGPLGREMYTKLFVYAGPDHKHAAQKPEALTF